MKTYSYLLGLLLNFSLLTCTYAQALETETISFFNNGPVANLFAVARPDFYQPIPEKQLRYHLQFELSNYISSTNKNDDLFYIDGETAILRQTWRFQYNEQLQFGFSIPWMRHSGGHADAFIYSFHDILQLPQNGRKKENEDQILWRLRHQGDLLLGVDDNLSGWGDVSITAQLTPSESSSVSWTFMTKLPTGRFEKQTGSEAIDLGFSYTEMNPDWFTSRTWLSDVALALWYGGGLSYLGRSRELSALDQYRLVAAARTGFSYSPYKNWQLKAQLDSQSPLFDTDIRELGWFPLIISFAANYQFTRQSNFEFVIVEDLRPRSAPDVIFQTNYKTLF